ncbi:BsuPI-related putative proteinase inhibitor [Oceanobacillus alkalisoli]|uniref:BsuPI-related putative proteinase inhibitor n=1 Tax=Oceanobacillus alkalisoli TaxID=2925113 RepID=UPI001EE4A2B6|nr:BsuPI-related putative proteinase inhibitor [Oceanobacillus alkalisoli]MCG5102645.1 BsuPI-related putative proteinase inhibitor [Oceanobacillus alkalisoli]
MVRFLIQSAEVMIMKKLIGILILLAALILTACQGENDEGQEEQPEDNNGQEEQEENGTEEENEGDENVDTELNFALNAEGDQMTYTVQNDGDTATTLRFSTSQKYEYEISDETGVISTYSEGKAFMQAVEEIELAAGDEQTFDVELPSLDPGEYTIKIYMTARDLAETSEKVETFEVTSDNSLNIN